MAGGETPLYVASRNGHPTVLELLIQAKAEVDTVMADGYTPLCIASYNGHTDIIKLLLQAGAGVDKPMKHGYTALLIAARVGHEATALALIAKGASRECLVPHPELAELVVGWHINALLARVSELEANEARFRYAIPHLIASAAKKRKGGPN
jgi:ankyrin repeat protein